ncbi:hypothetical protein OUZ56_029826 [Daphnia magna]|uniref:Uncharacterized protein n=1 Tax=Daphnia magna TaxID=35525 RepID=A0ABR0B7Y8_9CRUS|nr:hypothetical protein OUZ56_029826 [Daphnia magna]
MILTLHSTGKEDLFTSLQPDPKVSPLRTVLGESAIEMKMCLLLLTFRMKERKLHDVAIA